MKIAEIAFAGPQAHVAVGSGVKSPSALAQPRLSESVLGALGKTYPGWVVMYRDAVAEANDTKVASIILSATQSVFQQAMDDMPNMAASDVLHMIDALKGHVPEQRLASLKAAARACFT